MAVNKGKKWEEHFKDDWERCFPNTFCFRLKDQESRKKHASKNPCDFICFPEDKLFLIELKSHKGNTFPFSCLKQYDLLVSYKDLHNCLCGVLLWFRDHNKVIYINIEEITRMLKNNCKSINIKMLQTKEYNIIEIPCEELKGNRKYPKCDYIELVKNINGVE